jgi:hypothetical protein
MDRFQISILLILACMTGVVLAWPMQARASCTIDHDLTTPQEKEHALAVSKKFLAASMPLMATGLLANRTGFVMVIVFIAHGLGGADYHCQGNCPTPFTQTNEFFATSVGLIVGGFVLEVVGLVLLGQSIRHRKRSWAAPDIFIVPDLEAGKARFFFSWRF